MSFCEVGAEGFGGTWATQDHYIYLPPKRVPVWTMHYNCHSNYHGLLFIFIIVVKFAILTRRMV